MPYKEDKQDKNAARPPEGSLVETRCLIKGPKSTIVPFPGPCSGPKSRTGSGASQKAKSRVRAVFIPRPTNVRIWHKAVFKVGPVAGPKPNAIGSSKNASAPLAFPFSGRFRRRAINPTPPKRVKAWGDGPLRPEVMYPVVEHTRPNRAARNHSRSRAPHHRTQKNAR